VKIFKRILLALLILLLLVQIPFIYRRYQVGKESDMISWLAERAGRPRSEDSRFNEFKGIIHAHTSLGGHSTGGFDELIAAANANDLDFVLMTEHWSDQYDTSALTLNGVYGKTLFVGGNEIDTADGDRFLMVPGSADAEGLRKLPTTAVLEKLHAENRLALITYPEKFKSWDSNFDGIEVFSLHTGAKKANPLLAFFDLLWSYPAYPQLTLMRYFQRPAENLAKFDEAAAKRPISLFAGTDAHSNIGFHIFGDDAGNKLLNVKIDPYKTTFGVARAHVLISKDKPFNKDTLIEAIKRGQYFVGFDALGDTSGFEFTASGGAVTADEGGEIPLGSGVTLKADTHSGRTCRFVVYRNGEVFFESTDEYAAETRVSVSQPGTYRVEVYQNRPGSLFSGFPWIISNPIYIR
jgi:hypothetical protein